MLGHYDMKMVLPKDIPMLIAKATGNHTRPDNVFCSAGLLDSFTACDTDPGQWPVKTDHYPIISILDITPAMGEDGLRRNFRGTDWEEFRKCLEGELDGVPAPETYLTVADLNQAILCLDQAIANAIEKYTLFARPCPHSKRWWTKELSKMKKAKDKLARQSYRKWAEPQHHVHKEARLARNAYALQIRKAKAEHWADWLEGLDGTNVWAASQLATGPATDGGQCKIPTLQLKHDRTGAILCEATANAEKSEWLFKEFFPKKPDVSTVPLDFAYPEPAWEYQPITEAVLHRVIKKMKPYKATRSSTTLNCVYKYNSDLLVPRLVVIFRALDNLRYYPPDWQITETIVLRKPGKTDYSDVNAHRPVVLLAGHARLCNGAKTEQIVIMSEMLGLLSKNHYGGRPGRSTTDAIHSIVKKVKDAWRKGLVASLLLMDVKGAFPSVAVDRLLHNLWVKGILKEHTDWLHRRLDGRRMQLVFDGYTLEEFDIDNRLDQGDPQSVISYLFYNTPLAEIPVEKDSDSSVLFVDDNSILSIGKSFEDMGNRLRDIFGRAGGINTWAAEHNCTFGIKKYQLCQLTRRWEREVFRPRRTVPIRRPDLILNGHRIKAQPVVKLLGFHIDQELRWKAQGASALGKGQNWLVQVGWLAKVSKGIAAALMQHLYISTALPRILYGADVFLAPTQHNPGAMLKRDNRAIVAKMASIQRRAAIMITGAMTSTPADILDAHAYLLPIPLLIDKALHQAALRLATLPPTPPLYEAVKNASKRHVKRHPTPLHYLMNNYAGLKPHLVETIAAVQMKPSWAPKLITRIADSKEMAKREDGEERARVRVYSDGSGMDGTIGAAAVLYRDSILKRVKRYRLGSARHHTVYKGEGVGMILALRLIKEEREEVVGVTPLGVDSQVAIVAMGSIKPAPSHYIWDAFHNQLCSTAQAHEDMDLLVRWTPGHVDIEGNERADEEAKKAITDGSSQGLPSFLRKALPKSKSMMQQAYNKKLRGVASKSWQKSLRYQRMKDINPALPSPAFLRLTAKLPRKHTAILFQLRSGHVPLARHLYRLGKAESPICPCCNMHDESVDHFLFFCPAHAAARHAMYYVGGRDARVKSQLLSQPALLSLLFRFVAHTAHLRSIYGDIPALPNTDP
jgi:ribonuclease HI